MDIVYVVRDGANIELKYSLRSTVNVTHENVHVVGGVSSWLNPDTVQLHSRAQMHTPYRSTRAHIRFACMSESVSDPFMLWNDDFYAMNPVGEMPLLNRGPLSKLCDRLQGTKTVWARGAHETLALMKNMGVSEPISYDLHVPLIVHKKAMLEALDIASGSRCDGIHTRTIYGNIADLGGRAIPDPKMMYRSQLFPEGDWLSSGDTTFRGVIEPVLRFLFPSDQQNYERES